MASLESLNKSLNKASKALYEVSLEITDIPLAPKDQNIQLIAKILTNIFDIQELIYKQKPELKPEFLKKKTFREGSAAYETMGDAIVQKVSDAKILTKTEERQLFKQITSKKNVKTVKAKIIRANLQMVVIIAKRYIKSGKNITDLIEAGNIALLKAIDSFDYRKGYRFSTYAAKHIRQAIKDNMKK